jgi:methylthioribose-1-phosphate isomerase
MNVDGRADEADLARCTEGRVEIIDQRLLPHTFSVLALRNRRRCDRRHPATWLSGVLLSSGPRAPGPSIWLQRYLSRRAGGGNDDLAERCRRIKAARPTAVNLEWAVDRVQAAALYGHDGRGADSAVPGKRPRSITEEEAENCRRIGAVSACLSSVKSANSEKGKARSTSSPIATPAGWPSSITDRPPPRSTGLPAGIPVHVWVDETRPRNQGAASPPGNWANTACPTRSSSTMPAAT